MVENETGILSRIYLYAVLCPYPYVKTGSYCLSILEEHLSWPEAQQQCRDAAAAVGGDGHLAVADEDTHPLRSFVRENSALLAGQRE